jgi:hypothetical protein
MSTLIRSVATIVVVCCFTELIAAADDGKAEHHVTLDMRQDSGPYKNSAYSFRKATADPAVHRNYVDLLFNKCGSFHVNMVSGQQNRACDLGAITLKDSPDSAPPDAKWWGECFKPQAGHVYLEEISQHDQTMTVKFIIDEVATKSVKLTWVTVKPLQGPDDSRRGAAGTMGQCGATHPDH